VAKHVYNCETCNAQIRWTIS